MWSVRVGWAALAFLAGPAVSQALSDTSRAVQIVGSVALWIAWLVGLVASAVPVPASLTVLRLVAPGAPLVALAAVVRGVGPVAAGAALASTIAIAAVVFAAEVGEIFVQGGAYGDERRFPLRPPGPLVLGPLPLGWLLSFGVAAVGVLTLAARGWVLGGLCTLVGLPLATLFALRCHRLSRRFTVFVPAGFVLHDHLALVETAMFAKGTITGFCLAPADTEAADATGGALGPAVELRLGESGTIVLTDPSRPGGRALHVQSLLFSPSRPGRFLAAASERNLRVG